MDEEWGPWIEHDGKGCPCRGRCVEAVWLRISGETNISSDGDTVWIVPPDAGKVPLSSWVWKIVQGRPYSGGGVFPIIRYRIRKPRALLDMIERAKELDNAPEGPVRAKPRVTA